jgi:anti-sigma factor RsiW
MNCLSISEIYRYLEGDLSETRAAQVEHHLADCTACRQVLEERRHMLQACRRLPLWQAPPDFARQVLDRLFPQRLSLGRAFVTAVSGTGVIVTALFLMFLFSGQNLLSLLMSLNQSILNGLRDLAVYGAKFIKMVSLLTKVVGQFSQFIWESLARLSGLPGTEMQVALVVMGVLFTASLIFGVKRLFPIGEKP